MLYDLTLLSVTNVRQLVVLLCIGDSFRKKTTFQSELKCIYYLYYLVYLLGVGSLGEDLFSQKNLTADTFGQD